MLPSSLIGLLIFSALLTPGFCHLLVSERQRLPGRDSQSAFREVASIAMVSVAADVVVGLSLLAWHWWQPQRAPKLDLLARHPSTFWQHYYSSSILWLVGLLLAACGLAYMWGAKDVGSRLQASVASIAGLRHLVVDDDGAVGSAWWKVLSADLPDCYKQVSCHLVDDQVITGWLRSFSNMSAETGDRELVLSGPISISCLGPEGRTVTSTVDHGSLVVSARSIVHMTVRHHDDTPF